jgi:hypothetical protein
MITVKENKMKLKQTTVLVKSIKTSDQLDVIEVLNEPSMNEEVAAAGEALAELIVVTYGMLVRPLIVRELKQCERSHDYKYELIDGVIGLFAARRASELSRSSNTINVLIVECYDDCDEDVIQEQIELLEKYSDRRLF